MTSPTDTETVTAAQTPTLTIAKTASVPGGTADVAGELISYTVTVTNTGNVTLTNVGVTDPAASNFTCSPAVPAATLAPNGTISCTGDHTVTAAELNAGAPIVNVATATSNQTDPQTASTTTTVVKPDDKTPKSSTASYRTASTASSPRALIVAGCSAVCLAAAAPAQDHQPMKFTANGDENNYTMNFATSLSLMQSAARAQQMSKLNGLKGDAAALGLGALSDDLPPPLGLDVWVEGHVKHFSDRGDTSGDFSVFYLGADYVFNPNVLIGALVQVDWMNEKSDTLNYQIGGHGWMVGPYATFKLGQNVYFDARAAWGKSENRVSPFQTYTDTFETDRWLGTATLTGTWNHGNWRITPSASLGYAKETSEAYVDTNNVLVPSQTAELGRVTFGPEIGYRGRTSDGTIYEPHISLNGIWDFKREGDIKIDGIDVGATEFRARLEGGIIVTAPSGYSFRATANADGLGSDGLTSYGGEVWFNIPLH